MIPVPAPQRGGYGQPFMGRARRHFTDIEGEAPSHGGRAVPGPGPLAPLLSRAQAPTGRRCDDGVSADPRRSIAHCFRRCKGEFDYNHQYVRLLNQGCIIVGKYSACRRRVSRGFHRHRVRWHPRLCHQPIARPGGACHRARSDGIRSKGWENQDPSERWQAHAGCG